jgi:hypothetical protein
MTAIARTMHIRIAAIIATTTIFAAGDIATGASTIARVDGGGGAVTATSGTATGMTTIATTTGAAVVGGGTITTIIAMDAAGTGARKLVKI